MFGGPSGRPGVVSLGGSLEVALFLEVHLCGPNGLVKFLSEVFRSLTGI